MTELLYAYAVTGREPGTAVASYGQGVTGAPVFPVAEGELAALVSRVPAAGFDEVALQAQLEDLEWLERVARAHHEVVAAASSAGCALPLRLATVYRDEDGVRRMLRTGHDRLRAELDRLDGRIEWGVKVYTTPAAQAAPVGPAGPGAAPAGPAAARGGAGGTVSGRDYLRQRLRQRQTQDGVLQQSSDLADRLDAELSRLAEDRRVHRPQDPRLSRRDGVNVLNASYLVPAADAHAFAERARTLVAGETRVRVEMTGPWAPYSFAGTGATEAP
ncbi:GvpL/GvpF family gas vesicle protein [Actinacidiphila acidipaludis]|uniref:GvpL/GvpF family gas vesicle protein n=1 Tax=Actinacidiphila acidipaludis TaxID=2873382 RepID=A0ABS7QEU7_9ACTN|nr:GvpL/GvpF family gas vesicle protein [Streptomyces acidipaludis]MBY8881493.1 GvpL/GvpF family gas vesicle protein [Streptomyces acidipaludis]